MILICERCYAPLTPGVDRFTTLAHLHRALPDGSIEWVHSAFHVDRCGEPAAERSAAEPPDTGSWNATRRAISPAAAAWIARRANTPRPTVADPS